MVTTHHPSGSPAVSYGGRISQQGHLIFTVHGHRKLGLWLGWGWLAGSPDLSWCRRGSQGPEQAGVGPRD